METTLNITLIKDSKIKLESNVKYLTKFIKNRKLYLHEMESTSGIYAFWWLGKKEEFTEAILNCTYMLKGKNSLKDLIKVKFTKSWVDAATFDNRICLYIGKSTNIKSRISNHIKLGTDDIWKNGEGKRIRMDSGIKPNSSSQLRIGMERIFNEPFIEKNIDKIGVSWIKIDGYENGVNRFYLEGYFIGQYFPILNIDIER